jgi:hypothetical protein
MIHTVMLLALAAVALLGGVAAHKTPLILVNGVAGSVLQAKLNDVDRPHWYCSSNANWYTAWVSIAQIAPEFIKCTVDDLSLEMHSDGLLHNQEGVQVRVGYGDFSDVYNLDNLDHGVSMKKITEYFHPLIKHFEGKGYTAGTNLFAAAYDWRYGAVDLDKKTGYYGRLKTLIETAYNNNGETKVALLAHSMGAPVTHYFLTEMVSQDWKDKHIAVWLPVAPAYAGAVQAAISVLYGNDLGVAVLPTTYMQKLCAKSGSLPWLLPRPYIWEANMPFIFTPDETYSAQNQLDMLADRGLDQAYKIYERDLEATTKSSTFGAPLVDTYVFYGMNVSTPLEAHFDVNMWEVDRDDAAPKPRIVTGNGDGTVNMRSLIAGESWAEEQHNHDFVLEHKGFKDQEHMEIVQDSQLWNHIEDILATYEAVNMAEADRR